MSEEQKKSSIKEFNFKKGILVATFSGVMSASLLLRAGCRRADQGRSRPEHGTAGPVARAAGPGGDAAGRLHHELHLVRAAEHQEQDGLPVLQRHGPRRHRPAAKRRRSSKRPSMRRAKKSSNIFPLRSRNPPGCPCCRTTSSAPWPARPGTFSSSSTPWARPRWESTSFPVGPCTWPASSSSARSGESPCASGKARAGARSPW